MTGSMNSSRVDNLLRIHCIRIECRHFLRGDTGSIHAVKFFLLVLLDRLVGFAPSSIVGLSRLIKLVLVVNSRSLGLEKVVLSRTWPVVPIAGRAFAAVARGLLIGHEVLQLVSIVSDINCLRIVRCHHATGHDYIAVPFAGGASLLVVILHDVDCVALVVVDHGWLLASVRSHAFPRVEVCSVLGRSNAFGRPAERSPLPVVLLMSRCVWVHVDLLVQIRIQLRDE